MSKSKLNKRSTPELDERIASQMLENIFDACNVEPNSVPLSVLTSYSNYRRERFLLQRGLLVVIMLFFCFFPLLFMTPNISLKLRSEEFKSRPVYELTLDTSMPVSRITAVVDGSNVPVYETADKTYSIEPNLNGTMTVTVTLKNKQYTSTVVEVSGVDTESPTVLSDEKDEDSITLYLSDPDTGVDYENISGIDLEGNEVEPVSYNEKKGLVTFDYPKTTLNIYIPDKAGNKLHLILTVN